MHQNHTFLKSPNTSSSLVFDLDSSLDQYPCPVPLYAAKTFPMEDRLLPQYKRSFRVVPSADFLLCFASDRRHMRDKEGKWQMPPPVYQCIRTQGSVHNLEEFVSMDQAVGWGQVINLDGFLQYFGSS